MVKRGRRSVKETIELEDDEGGMGIFVDIGFEGEIVGIEILNASMRLGKNG